MCVACGAAIWWSNENSGIVRDRLQREILGLVRNKYGKGAFGATERIVDSIQKDFACCGVKGYQDWAYSFYNQGPDKINNTLLDYGVVGGSASSPTSTASSSFKVPPSCCSLGLSQPDCERFRSDLSLSNTNQGPVAGIHYDGCWYKLNRYLEEQWRWLIFAAVLIIGVQFFALILSCCLCCAISRSDKE